MAQKHSGDLTATGAGAAQDFGVSFSGSWTMVVTDAAPDTQIALETSPDNSTWTRQATVTGQKSCALIGGGLSARYGRANVIALGTGKTRVGAVLVAS